MGLGRKWLSGLERESFMAWAALVVGCLLLCVAVSAVVGAVTYAGWVEPGSGLQDDCQTPP